MKGKISKTEKILLLCTAVFLLMLTALFVRDSRMPPAEPLLRTDRTAGAEELIPPSAWLVNINTATAEQLTELPGIGKTLAERIVSYRETHGTFRKKTDLLSVEGIGQDTFAQLMDEITVEEEPT